MQKIIDGLGIESTNRRQLSQTMRLRDGDLVSPWIIEWRNGLEMCVGGQIKTWGTASPFEAIRVDGSQYFGVMVCQHSAGCSPFSFTFVMRVVQASYGSWFLRPQKVS